MADNEYINSGYITKMGDNSTHNGSAGQPVDGVDFPHSGLIKALNAMATTGYAGLTASTGTGSKNFNMQMNDSSGLTVITVRTGKVIRGGVLMDATTEATITEIIHSGSMTDTSIQFQEVTADSSGANRYHLIVVDSTNAVKIRQSPGVDKVADLSDGDIPIAVLRMQKGEAKATRHIQYLTSSETDGIGLDIDGYSALGGTGLHQTQDHFVFSDNGTEKKISFTNLEDAIFGNVSGDIAIAAGGAATIQANSVALGTDTVGNYMTDVSAGTGIDVTHTPAEGSTATIAVDVSDFMTNGANNRIVTATGTDGMNAEANAQFDGSTLSVTGAISATTSVTGTVSVSGANFLAGFEVLDAAAGVPVPTLTKKVIYSFNLAPIGNTFAMPNAVAQQIHHIKNIDPVNPITITATGGETIDQNDTGHPYVTAPSTITLAPQTGVILQGVNDSIAPLTPGWMIIGIA
tara:strand:- start:14027 stop:15412 length:1386 start_codon:yes stop_codon:yes gene_type:complete